MLTFSNIWTKKFLARRGPVKIFGRDVERRERLNDQEAIDWFDYVWKGGLGQAVEAAQACDCNCVCRKLRGEAAGFVKRVGADYREFLLEGCLFIAQLVQPGQVNQLWFVASSSGGDPRSLVVKFKTMAIREKFEEAARRVGLSPGEYAAHVLLNLLESGENGKDMSVQAKS